MTDAPQTATGARPSRWLPILALLALAAVALHGALLAPALRYPIPFSDVWDYIARRDQLLSLRELLTPHNEHLVATTKLALWLDGTVDRFRLRLIWGLALLAAVAPLVLLALAARRQGTREAVVAAAALGTALVGFNAAHIAGFPFFLQHLLFVLLTLACGLLLAPASLARLGSGGLAWRLAGAVLLMLVSQVTTASGAATGLAPGLLLLAMPRNPGGSRGRLAGLALILATLAAWYLLYLRGHGAARHSAGVLDTLLYILQVLGLPLGLSLSRSDPAPAAWAGLAVLLLLLACLWHVLRRPGTLATPLGAGAAALILACGASALGVGYARAGTPWSPLDPKYLNIALPMIGGAVALLLLGRPPARGLAARALPALLLAVVPALNLIAALALEPAYRAHIRDLATREPALMLLVADPLVVHAGKVERYSLDAAILRQDGLSVFATPRAALPGSRLGTLAARERGDCVGAFYESAPVPLVDPLRPGGKALRVAGNASAPWPADLLVFAAGEGEAAVVVGYALLLRPGGADPAHPEGGAWVGYLATDAATPGPLAAHLVDGAAGYRCRAFAVPPP